jgi:hypothetical protein
MVKLVELPLPKKDFQNFPNLLIKNSEILPKEKKNPLDLYPCPNLKTN